MEKAGKRKRGMGSRLSSVDAQYKFRSCGARLLPSWQPAEAWHGKWQRAMQIIDVRIPRVHWMGSADESGDDMFQGSSSSPNQRGHGDGGDELTREDLLMYTGSAESGTSMEDTVHSVPLSRYAMRVHFPLFAS